MTSEMSLIYRGIIADPSRKVSPETTSAGRKKKALSQGAYCRQAGMSGLPITVTVRSSLHFELSVRLLTGAAGEATDLKLKNLNLYLRSVQQVALNQILLILNLLLHSSSNLYMAESYSDSRARASAFLSL